MAKSFRHFQREVGMMSANSKKSITWMFVLVLLGIAVLYGGTRSLVVTLPAAFFVWYAAAPMLRSGRN